MRWLLAVAALLALQASPANAASVFLADAVFDFDSTAKTSPTDSNGTGAYGAFNNPSAGSPLVVSSSGITATFSRLGQVPPANIPSKFDVKALDTRFPGSWGGGSGGGALDPFFVTGVTGTPGSGSGANCALFGNGTTVGTLEGCTYFLAQFDTILDRASLEFSDLSFNPGEVDTLEVRVFPGTNNSQVVVPIAGSAFVNGDPNLPLAVTADPLTGTLRVNCAASQCGEGNFVQLQIFAEGDEIFRSILFRGFGTVDGEAMSSNSVYVDNIAVGTGIPEPATVALLGFGTAAVIGLARLRRE